MQTGSVSWTWDVTSGCLGALTAGNEAMVRDTATGARLGPGEVGEITYRSPLVMLGYVNRPEENRQFFGDDGFCHSGDLGHYDEKGMLYFDGRLKAPWLEILEY